MMFLKRKIIFVLCASIAISSIALAIEDQFDEKVDSNVSESDLAEGKALYAQCGACHLPSGDGVKGAFPPLKGRIAVLSSSPQGREYIQSVLIQGLNGLIDVDGQQYNGYMQAYGNILSDEQISSVLNYVSLELVAEVNDDFHAYTPNEVALTRKRIKSAGKSSNDLRKNAFD